MIFWIQIFFLRYFPSGLKPPQIWLLAIFWAWRHSEASPSGGRDMDYIVRQAQNPVVAERKSGASLWYELRRFIELFIYEFMMYLCIYFIHVSLVSCFRCFFSILNMIIWFIVRMSFFSIVGPPIFHLSSPFLQALSAFCLDLQSLGDTKKW